jgi:hypothetical protein
VYRAVGDECNTSEPDPLESARVESRRDRPENHQEQAGRRPPAATGSALSRCLLAGDSEG